MALPYNTEITVFIFKFDTSNHQYLITKWVSFYSFWNLTIDLNLTSNLVDVRRDKETIPKLGLQRRWGMEEPTV